MNQVNLGSRNPQTPRRPLPTAPPAAPPPGFRGTPPMPVGSVIKRASAGPKQDERAPLTDYERQSLQALGIPENEPIPPQMASIIKTVVESAKASTRPENLPPPVPMSTPKLAVTTQDLANLSPEDKQRIFQGMREANAANAAARQAEAQQARAAQSGVNPSVQQAAQFANQVVDQQQQGAPTFTVQNDLPEGARGYFSPTPAAQATIGLPGAVATVPATPLPTAPEPAPAPAPPPAGPEPGITGAALELTHCPHCSWPLDVEDTIEPSTGDKQAFLQSILGEIPYVREYDLLGGALRATFRTLTVREADAVFSHAHHELKTGKITNNEDFFERVNRLRLFLQLRRLTGAGQFDHGMPDGLTPDTNPHAAQHWQAEPLPAPFETGEEPLFDQIEAVINTQVIKTETVARVIRNALAQFNRLVAKLEALCDNPDFWNETGAPS